MYQTKPARNIKLESLANAEVSARQFAVRERILKRNSPIKVLYGNHFAVNYTPTKAVYSSNNVAGLIRAIA